jgi:hypothetical protein
MLGWGQFRGTPTHVRGEELPKLGDPPSPRKALPFRLISIAREMQPLILIRHSHISISRRKGTRTRCRENYLESPLQLRVMNAAGHDSDMASAANISASNLGSAIGSVARERSATLAATRVRHPERFTKNIDPKMLALPGPDWIDQRKSPNSQPPNSHW